MPGKTGTSGFTLVELMIVIALLAIVALIAAPSFTDMIERNRLQSQAEELRSFLLYARGEAVTLRSTITVETDDEEAWVIERGGTTIRQFEHNPELVTIRSSAETITFRSNGTATAATFTVCHDDDAARGYFLEIQSSGATSLYLPGKKDASNTALDSCTL
ncbi:GspH/FimT family pseudopilin [Pseudomonas chengduensis]|jgi:type IV fimbrial biogenesis protein FimU|uniref:Type II secretion system protein H n=1 Tax=Pseudomonas sihuiensis TaxID=1274359 RepID=A0A1H2N9U8_9PSED|nr:MULTISPECIES: GspH/FimT family pseudopilin [Pseudomonas]MDH1213039.1 GspH/FimT family pseudopilin [Pseudomonas chengduensis]TXR38743.1 prepilin-type N-terminal cleavage/methylation domain-containing protein [Pseudomonas mendocina]SDV02277.1 type IV fimbrial biogenesis protein FimU [Pseudomonas sihuiensis]